MNTRTLCKITLIFPFFLCFISCGGNAARSTARTELVLGTLCRIELYGAGTPERYGRLFARLGEIEKMMSMNLEGSEVSRVNRMAGIEPVPVSPELFTVLEEALYFAEASGGAFDPTIGPLVKLWDIGGDNPRVPAPEEIAAALELVNWRDMELTSGREEPPGGKPFTAAFLRRRGMALDLGAIAKGFAADELAGILRDEGVRAAVIDLGGNICVYGTKPEAAGGGPVPWRVGIQNPLEERGSYAGYVETGGAAVVTSGVYERYFTGEDGRRWHHILDTGTGCPVENGLLSVTITAAVPEAVRGAGVRPLTSAAADALSTACFALGYEKGRALAEANGAGAIFIFENRTIRLNRYAAGDSAAAAFTLTGTSFTREQEE